MLLDRREERKTDFELTHNGSGYVDVRKKSRGEFHGGPRGCAFALWVALFCQLLGLPGNDRPQGIE
jgi:hypothetical protein